VYTYYIVYYKRVWNITAESVITYFEVTDCQTMEFNISIDFGVIYNVIWKYVVRVYCLPSRETVELLLLLLLLLWHVLLSDGGVIFFFFVYKVFFFSKVIYFLKNNKKVGQQRKYTKIKHVLLLHNFLASHLYSWELSL
jgi:hypothetical protein